jgi:hypothetical protein
VKIKQMMRRKKEDDERVTAEVCDARLLNQGAAVGSTL